MKIDRVHQHFSLDTKILMSMKVGERHDWPFSMANDIRPKICCLKKKNVGTWQTKVSHDKSRLMVTRLS